MAPRCLLLVGADVMSWYEEQPRNHVAGELQEGEDPDERKTINQYFGTRQCLICGDVSPSNVICQECYTSGNSRAVLSLTSQLGALRNAVQKSELVCLSCSGSPGWLCSSLDCPSYYRRRAARYRERVVPALIKLIDDITL